MSPELYETVGGATGIFFTFNINHVKDQINTLNIELKTTSYCPFYPYYNSMDQA